MEKTAKEKIRNLEYLRNNSIKNFNHVFGAKKDSRYDKTQFDFSTEDACHKLHDVIYFRHHKGVYGDSGVSSVFNSKLSKYIARAINEKKYQIFNRALEMISSDICGMVVDLKLEKDILDVMIKEIEDAPQGTKEAVENIA